MSSALLISWLLLCAEAVAFKPSARLGSFRRQPLVANSGFTSKPLDDTKTERLCDTFGRRQARGDAWYECNQPSDEPNLICFMAPAWMGLTEGAYVCSSNLESDNKLSSIDYAEDSY
eukprot:CAMPEP_0119308880 /NCGR_PEP_ID=MMETSP1333-20130426/12823_1 /TAXON_ID=418940 /ORGANISM="Scyphosphaera apsteinii, Strain RCC1455" /LENGTH=116 /DNA_ID=CAMNT_0007312753 /DNA_START=17 /DNA_END=367 /DNA_ORIENTATION=+